MTEPRSARRPATAPADSRTALGRALETRDFTYDLSRGREEPAAVTAARERHRAVNARIRAACAALDAQEAGDEH